VCFNVKAIAKIKSSSYCLSLPKKVRYKKYGYRRRFYETGGFRDTRPEKNRKFYILLSAYLKSEKEQNFALLQKQSTKTRIETNVLLFLPLNRSQLQKRSTKTRIETHVHFFQDQRLRPGCKRGLQKQGLKHNISLSDAYSITCCKSRLQKQGLKPTRICEVRLEHVHCSCKSSLQKQGLKHSSFLPFFPECLPVAKAVYQNKD